MFSGNKEKNILFVFDEEKEHPIHSFFVPYSFDAVYLDRNMNVLEIFRVKPWEWKISNKKPAKYLLESFKLNSIPKIGEELKCSGGKF